MKKLLPLLMLLFVPFVYAKEATVTCTPPTQYEDGSPLPPEEIDGYNLYSSDNTSGPYTLYAKIQSCNAVIQVPNKLMYFVATTVDINGNESDYSNEAVKVPVKPGKPTNLNFQQDSLMRLVQVRECNGSCCRQSPRFPNEDNTDCIYHSSGPEGCNLKNGSAQMPSGMCPAIPHMTAEEAFNYSCRDWPANMPGRDTGDCCWQWVDD